MDATRIGADVRLLRRRKRWTQARLAAEAGATRWFVSEIECGRGDRLTGDVLARVVAATGGYLSVRVTFRGEALDRLRDRAHAALVDAVVGWLTGLGWDVATEVSFNVYGERGAIDILAFHSTSGTLLVVEIKTVIPDVGGMLSTLDRKVRLARDLGAARGWDVRSVSRLLVVASTRTSRRRVEGHAATFSAGFPDRAGVVRRWVRAPTERLNGLLFWVPQATSR